MLHTKTLIALALAPLAALLPTTGAAEEGFTSIFNGENLSRWDGNPDLWSVENGTITGKTTDPAQLKYNQFLIWRGGTVKNFELRAKIKTTGNNTGIQYRSKELPENGKWSVGGYQCDIHPNAPFNAMIYEERGRGITVQNGQGVVADPEGKRWLTDQRDPIKVDPTQWHEYTIIAVGNHIVHKIDGTKTIEFHDFDKKARSLEGLLAFQIHRGPAMQVHIKDVMLKTLPVGVVIDFENFAIPRDAQVIEKMKPAPQKQKQKPAPKKKSVAKRNKPPQVGPAIGENKATPIANITRPDGFQIELLYSVPGVEQSSWVNLCNDDKGRIYASDQNGGLYRFTPPAPGKELSPNDVQKLSTCPPVHLSTCPPVRLSTCPPVHLRRRHGVRFKHALVPPDTYQSRRQRRR